MSRWMVILVALTSLGCVEDPRDENPPESLGENVCLSIRLTEKTNVMNADGAVGLELFPSGQNVEFPWFEGEDVWALGSFKAPRDGEVVLAQVDARPSSNLARFAQADGTAGGGISEDIRCDEFAENPPVLAYRREVRRGETYWVRFDAQSEFGVNFYLDYADNWVNWSK
ncbi:hypothetical protein FRD01_14055 [Microvenator marinus]|uniref:Uncharacterized protein n=1 Tax=Microvenator marinus TaxID=2600177 RepID=A0A5B8XS08_9DELT|nr:hypothetical protein [Microvenator marinus]QED28334.1 hypothetical protein FRD01_14055 [Microvenator marinus]